MQLGLLTTHLDPRDGALAGTAEHMVDRGREPHERRRRVFELVIGTIRLRQQLHLHAAGGAAHDRPGCALKHADRVHRGAFDDREARVGPNDLGEPDPAVRRVLATKPCRHESLGVAEQALAGLATPLEVGRERRSRCRGQPLQHERDVGEPHCQAELFGGNSLEVVRLVDDQRLVVSEHLSLTLVCREQERMVGDNNGRICCGATRAHHVASRIGPVAARRAEAVGHVGCDTAPEMLLVPGEIDLRPVTGPGRGEPGEDLQLEPDRGDIGVRSVGVWCIEESLPASKADVVVATLQHRDGDRLVEQARDRRKVAVGELLLEVDGVRGDHGALPGARRPERQRCQIGERLPDPGAGLHHEAALALERLPHRDRHLVLRLAILVPVATGEWPIRTEEHRGGLTDIARRDRRGADVWS